MSNNLDLPHLVRVCEAATPGPWRYANYTIYDHRGDRIATIPEGCHYIANFIAIFNPSTVLALLRRLGEAEERVRQLESGYTERQSSIRCNKCGSAMEFSITGVSFKSEDAP